jgi:hypothetical protein
MYLSRAFTEEFMWNSPFSNLSQSQEKRFTYSLLIVTILVIVIMSSFDRYLTNEICGGIIDFEFSKDVETAQKYMDSWGDIGRNAAGLSLGLDFLFPLLYTTFIALLVHKLNVRLWSERSFFKVGLAIIWLQFLAGLFDYVENLGLIKLLLGATEPIWASLAYYFAAAKFLLVFVGIGYILINFGIFLVKKRT